MNREALVARTGTQPRQVNQRQLAAAEAQLHVALDNMPGALIYTDDDLNIVICNERLREMYRAPSELLQPGRPYPEFLRFLAENGFYGAGDIETLVARRVESLRNPSNMTFEDRTPDGRVYRIRRRRVEAGGVVTVMTDITEQKKAELELVEAKRRTEEANGLAKRHDISRNLIRIWVQKYEAEAFDEDATAADMIQEYEARIAALERLVGKQALELEFLKGAVKGAPRPRSGPTSAITGPAASPSPKDVG